MVALLDGGEAVGAWMLDPLTGVLHHAARGHGAWRDGERLRIDTATTALRQGIVKTRFLPGPVKARVDATAWRIALQPGANCAGADYPAVVAGESDVALYWRTLPWDHAPGVLFVAEAGGHAARLDGAPYRAADPRPGLLVARSRRVWDEAVAAWAG